jgi:hypothetical protein
MSETQAGIDEGVEAGIEDTLISRLLGRFNVEAPSRKALLAY